MPGNRGPLIISGSFAWSENYNREFNNLSQMFKIHEELEHIRKNTNMDLSPQAQ
jgi:hypothetical protein